MFVRFAFALFAAAAGGLLLAGCNPGGSGSPDGEMVEVTRRVERGVTPGGRTLVFDGFNGDVTLHDTTAQEADLTFVQHARAGSREDARALFDEVTIEERGEGEEYIYRMRSGATGQTSVDVRGSVPQDTHLRVTLQNGDVALSGVQGPIDVNNENGSIRVGGAAAATRLETRNGAVEAGLRRLPSGAEVRLQSANGDLELTVPATASASVAARTNTGEITAGGLNFDSRSLDQEGAGARFEGELGEGEATIDLRTENGNITLRQGTVRRLPDVGGGAASAAASSAGAAPDSAAGLDSLITPPANGSGRGDDRDTTDPGGRLDSEPTPPDTGDDSIFGGPTPQRDTMQGF